MNCVYGALGEPQVCSLALSAGLRAVFAHEPSTLHALAAGARPWGWELAASAPALLLCLLVSRAQVASSPCVCSCERGWFSDGLWS